MKTTRKGKTTKAEDSKKRKVQTPGNKKIDEPELSDKDLDYVTGGYRVPGRWVP